MSTLLSQSSSSAFPDRGSVGLQVSFDVGTDGSYLVHDLAQEQGLVHVRLLLDPGSAHGGKVRLVGGQGEDDQPSWWVDYDTDARQVSLELATGQSNAVALSALQWHCVEVKVDTGAGEAALRINGLDAGVMEGVFALPGTRRVWLGGTFKEHALVGVLHLDEWCIAEDWIGPVRVEPISAYADDPARWLVVYNAADSDAVLWAQAYRQARHVPYANLLGLVLSTSEVIDADGYAHLTGAIETYLQDSGLSGQVLGILVGYRVPGYVEFHAGWYDAVAALLHRDMAGFGYVDNVHAGDALPQRPTREILGADRLTARMDGPNLAAALSMIDRATAVRQGSLEGEAGAGLWLDPLAGDGATYSARTQEIIAWAGSLDCQRTRLPLHVSGDLSSPQVAGAFERVHGDAFFWGWAEASPPEGFFAEPAGARVFSLQFEVHEAVATTVRSVQPNNWIDVALSVGYAAAAATSRVCSATAAPHPRPFFAALGRGWTLAEAWYLALPLLREGFYLVGDPLMTCALPRSGWDLFGPLHELEGFDPLTPSVALPVSVRERELVGSLRPSLGEQGMYVVRRVDEAGRSEASVSLARGVNLEHQFKRLPLMPTWPAGARWSVQVEAGQVVLLVAWERALRTCNVQRVELLGELDGQPAAVVYEAEVDPRASQVVTHQPLPKVGGRYRWRVHSPDGVTAYTPWSRWVQPRTAADRALTFVEEPK